MSSLSYNWQNEFSDLRYQVDQLQKTDPAKYSALGANLGLKPGQQVQVPSQYSPQWASQFVMAAGLYTPPAPTFDPATATPTTPSGISISGLMISTTATGSATVSGSVTVLGSVTVSGSATGSAAAITSESHHSGDSKSQHSGDAATAGLDTESGSAQFGNPIAGNINTNDTPIIPSGIGYSSASKHTYSLLLLILIFI
ncbi:hypothetical protein GGI13_003715 [Coemansia sp. RSA 455]|nr:hypothetical protein H4S03_005097 [Coemansia sp. S3946]KAJ2052687.1 hypothetical protein H4S04_001173 [Coemansia sp. S16]KAJ2068206.1 hypothetical protein GGI08_000991 [Coemansia sp. S2]KAJ2075511.1 hypothetical protein GGH13_000551 [Coemansia sp. S155-1]KAJ2101008.1 hypothetical protein GGI09_001987 [Coemansia sp. S100]KAJ2108224.1 hypothetical protein GGI16_001222 [Coemansia sp. S142-1]KAJ2115939.1 hypothetical protein IW146_001929 [Coemansia sp. RSA 922]KAJ2251670.1 hypothetical protei